jgi:CBS domain-containing protein
MQVKDVMVRKVETVHPDDTLLDAATKMRTYQVDLLPVYENDQLVGTLSDRDITELAARVGLSAGRSRVRDAMTRDIVTCSEHQDLEEVARSVDQRTDGEAPEGVLVLDENKRPVGFVPTAALRLDYESTQPGGIGAGPIEDVIPFHEDQVDFMSDESFPASDPLPPPSAVSPFGEEEKR